MSQQSAGENAGPPEVIYVIRHGEKPAEPPPVKKGRKGNKHKHKPAPPFGVDFDGRKNVHGLLPRGWQRSGALGHLFDPAHGPSRAGLRTPATLLSPAHGDLAETAGHRAYQTIQGVAGRLGLAIGAPFEVGQESQLAVSLVSVYSGVVLVCWDHQRIPALAGALPTAPGTTIPGQWPGDRYDVIWAFSLLSGQAEPRYAFSQVPQRLLSGDSDTVIARLPVSPGMPRPARDLSPSMRWPGPGHRPAHRARAAARRAHRPRRGVPRAGRGAAGLPGGRFPVRSPLRLPGGGAGRAGAAGAVRARLQRLRGGPGGTRLRPVGAVPGRAPRRRADGRRRAQGRGRAAAGDEGTGPGGRDRGRHPAG